MSHYTALIDANVLYLAPLRDLLMQLAVTDMFRAKWTADIHREWIDALLENEPHRSRVGSSKPSRYAASFSSSTELER